MGFFFGSVLQQNHPWDTIICEVLAESDIFLTREHFVNPAAVEHLLLAFWKSCGRSYFYLSQKNRQNMLRVIIMSVFRIIIGQ